MAKEVLPVDGLYVPAGQDLQALEEVLPVDGLYDPAEQETQAVCPVFLLYDPAGQEVEAATPMPGQMKYESSHVSSLNVPLGQTLHLKYPILQSPVTS